MDATLTQDSLFDGELICLQHRDGYRFSIDAVLLAHFVEVKTGDRIIDLGAGSGIISLILLYRWQQNIEAIVAIEAQQELAELATRNFLLNRMSPQASAMAGDICAIASLVEAESFDRVVCNPPFYPPQAGRNNHNREAMLARHQVLAGLHHFLRASAFAVKNGGTVSFIYPADQIGDFIPLAKASRLEIKRLQLVYSYPDRKAKARLALIQCVKNGGSGAAILSPFYVYAEKKGPFSPEMATLYRPNQAADSMAVEAIPSVCSPR